VRRPVVVQGCAQPSDLDVLGRATRAQLFYGVPHAGFFRLSRSRQRDHGA
jgi:hypothetical protein